jgi:hypothetical protein
MNVMPGNNCAQVEAFPMVNGVPLFFDVVNLILAHEGNPRVW